MKDLYGRLMIDINGKNLSDEDKFIISNKHVGGLILFSRNFESFEQLKKNGHLECAICSSKEVEKSLMVPRINTRSDEKQKTLISAQSAIEKEIKALKHKIKTKCNS